MFRICLPKCFHVGSKTIVKSPRKNADAFKRSCYKLLADNIRKSTIQEEQNTMVVNYKFIHYMNKRAVQVSHEASFCITAVDIIKQGISQKIVKNLANSYMWMQPLFPKYI